MERGERAGREEREEWREHIPLMNDVKVIYNLYLVISSMKGITSALFSLLSPFPSFPSISLHFVVRGVTHRRSGQCQQQSRTHIFLPYQAQSSTEQDGSDTATNPPLHPQPNRLPPHNPNAHITNTNDHHPLTMATSIHPLHIILRW